MSDSSLSQQYTSNIRQNETAPKISNTEARECSREDSVSNSDDEDDIQIGANYDVDNKNEE